MGVILSSGWKSFHHSVTAIEICPEPAELAEEVPKSCDKERRLDCSDDVRVFRPPILIGMDFVKHYIAEHHVLLIDLTL